MRIRKLSRAAYPVVDDLITQAEKEGLEDGWTSAGASDGFEQMVRAEIQVRDGKINGDVEPGSQEQIERIRSWKQEVELRKQEYEARHGGDAPNVSETDFSWRRCARVCAFFGMLGLFITLAGAELDWRALLALSLGAALVILRPRGSADSLRAGLVHSREDLGYLRDCWRLWRLKVREDRLESWCEALQQRREVAERRVEGLTKQVLGHYGAQRERAEVAKLCRAEAEESYREKRWAAREELLKAVGEEYRKGRLLELQRALDQKPARRPLAEVVDDIRRVGRAGVESSCLVPRTM